MFPERRVFMPNWVLRRLELHNHTTTTVTMNLGDKRNNYMPVLLNDSATAKRLIDAVEGECDGLAITQDQAKAILDYIFGD